MFEKYSFIKLTQSSFPGIIIDFKDNDLSYLISIVEYQGDYLFTDKGNIFEISLSPEEKLSILGKFGKWFYDQHKDIFQQVILENLQIYLYN